ncbi:hypothetical protein F6X40_36420 [Paraburkholderia sp. UCT31]|uniref:hypothetical protein n=1 Tax=Paraburkholderia sp. UCT31 TaxID=2615209 RepID=UPI001656057C|nr:hypothetical protein [Paraburkholderia sp. UCT31]MBC8742027.1 hypothetical protein [Paraburkholderia sp. UCT31]
MLDDEMKRALGEHINDREARRLYLTDRLLSAARRVGNYSTSPGANLMREAEAAVAARAAERQLGSHQDASWNAFRARVDANVDAKQS